MIFKRTLVKRFAVLICAILSLFCGALLVHNIQVEKQLAFADIAFSNIEIKQQYDFNTVFNAPEMVLTVNGTEHTATSILYYPDDTAKKADNAVLSQVGEYVLVYKVVVAGKVYEQSYNFEVIGNAFSVTGTSETYFGKHSYLGDVEGRVVSLSDGGVFTYNKIIDVSTLTKADSFIKFFILPNKIGVQDVGQIRVRLTDAHDPQNYVTIITKQSDNQVVNTANASNGQVTTGCEPHNAPTHSLYPVAEYQGQYYKLFKSNKFGSYNGGYVSMTGIPPYGDVTTNYMEFFFDYEEKALFNRRYLIADLDDVSFFSNTWEGFTTGEVYLSIEGEQYYSGDFTIMITNIMGEDLSQTFVRDDSVPNLTVDTTDYANSFPYGVVGEKFPVFNATAFDMESGTIEVVRKVYWDYFNAKTEVGLSKEGYFVPQKAGLYTIEYSAVDDSGNRVVKTIGISVYAEVEPLNIVLGTEYDEQGTVGTEILVKDYLLQNVNGLGKCVVKAIHSTKDISYDVENGKFFPLYSGNYKIVYQYNDYVYSRSSEYEMNVTVSEKPYLDESTIKVADYYVNNLNYQFSNAKSYNLSSGEPVETNTYVAVYNDNQEEYTVYNATDAFVVGANNTIKLRYFSVNSNFVTDVENVDFTDMRYVSYKDFEAKVKNVGIGTANIDFAALFDTDEYFDISKTSKYISFISQEKAQTENFARIRFINDFYLNAFSLEVGFTENSPIPESFDVKFYRSNDKSLAYKITYIFSADTVSLSINDEAKKYSVAKNGTQIVIESHLSERTLKAYNGVAVDFKTCYDGSSIDNLLGEELYFEVDFSGITADFTFTISRIANQPISNLKFDLISPIVSNISIAGSYKLNSEYIISPTYAYDIVNPLVNFSLKVTDPDGNVVSDINGNKLIDVDPSEERVIVLDKYGDYMFVYLADDGGNAMPVRAVRTIQVVDMEKPIIALDSYKAVFEVGETVKIATATASDNITENLIVTSYYIDNSATIKLIKDGQFVASHKGKYVIYYSTSDNQGNWCFVSYEIEVR